MHSFIRKLSGSCFLIMFLAMPASTNYEFHDFGFGAGGTGLSDSGNYSMNAILGEVSGAKNVGTTYNLGPGLEFTRQSNVSAAPTFTNPSSYYNKLQFILDTGGNPSDAVFAIAISTDDFTTTNYIQADDTIGSSAVYQTYANWGGASGEYVTGLASGTTYKIKSKVMHTKYTETEFSAAASATTSSPTLTFDLDVSATDSETAAPYTLAIGTLAPGSVTTATEKIWIDIETNAQSGGFVYVYGLNGGLSSSEAGYTITSASTDLAVASEGYGTRVNTVAESAGGPLTAVSPYNGSTDNVGVLDTTSRNILTTAGAAITAGRASLFVKAKASGLTPSASDYRDVLTFIASGSF